MVYFDLLYCIAEHCDIDTRLALGKAVGCMFIKKLPSSALTCLKIHPLDIDDIEDDYCRVSAMLPVSMPMTYHRDSFLIEKTVEGDHVSYRWCSMFKL
jgi:hypothetical protein